MTRGVFPPDEQLAKTNARSADEKREWGVGSGTRRCAAGLRFTPSRTTPHSPLPELRNTPNPPSQQVREQSIRPDHARGQLPEKAQPRVDVRTAAERRDQQTTVERRPTGVVSLEDRHVGRVPLMREIKAALLDPTLPVVVRDGIRRM